MENQNEFREKQYLENSQVPLPNSTAVLILGIASLVGSCCYGVGWIFSIIALILGSKDRRLYRQNPAAYTQASYSNLKAGRVCAIIGLIVSAIFFLIIIGLLIIFGTVILYNPESIYNQLH